jgi:hypothetical protein
MDLPLDTWRAPGVSEADELLAIESDTPPPTYRAFVTVLRLTRSASYQDPLLLDHREDHGVEVVFCFEDNWDLVESYR